METSIYQLFDHYEFYDEVYNYLYKEIKNKTVHFDQVYLYDETRETIHDLTTFVKDIHFDDERFILYIVNDKNESYIIPERSNLKWVKTINRNITELDPYGEEEDD